MRGLLLREALVVARKPAVVCAVVAYGAVLGLLLLAWGGDRVPGLPGTDTYDQLYLLQRVLLAAVMPWAAARAVATERGDDLVRLSAILAMPPSRLMMVRFVAAASAPGLVVVCALPIALVATQIAAVPAWRALIDQATLLVFALPAGVVAVCWMQIARDRLFAWLGAASSAVLLLALLQLAGLPLRLAAGVAAIAAIGAAATLAARADVLWRYLSEDPA